MDYASLLCEPWFISRDGCVLLLLLLLLSSPQPRAPEISGHCLCTAGPHHELQISVGTAQPQSQPRAPAQRALPGRKCGCQIDLSGHRWTSTASSRSQWALPDLNRERPISVGTAGPQRRATNVRETATKTAR